MLCAVIAQIVPDPITIVALAGKAYGDCIGKTKRFGRLQFYQAEVAERNTDIAIIVATDFRQA